MCLWIQPISRARKGALDLYLCPIDVPGLQILEDYFSIILWSDDVGRVWMALGELHISVFGSRSEKELLPSCTSPHDWLQASTVSTSCNRLLLRAAMQLKLFLTGPVCGLLGLSHAWQGVTKTTWDWYFDSSVLQR